MIKKLTKRELIKQCKTIYKDWELSAAGDTLTRAFTFPSFVDAFLFVTRVSIHSEVMKQYPHIVLDHETVTLTLRNDGSLTVSAENFELARKVDVVFTLSTARVRRGTSQR